MKKEIVLLAKSVKNGQNCIAGREILRIGSKLQLGPWIRPVSNHDSGAVSQSETLLEGGGMPGFLDIIEIDVKTNEKNSTQSENWLIEKRRWKKTGRIAIGAVFSYFVENPHNLWIGTSNPTDRIGTNNYIASGYNSSLCIIKPDSFEMEIFSIFNEFEGREQKKRRGKFQYNGVNYDLAITDPEIHRKYFIPFPRIEDGKKQIKIDSSKCLLCISLGQEFRGYLYKLIATVIEND